MPSSDFPFLKRALALGLAGALLPGAQPGAQAALLSASRQVASGRVASAGSRAAARTPSYLLGPGDEIRVTVKDYPEFNVDPTVVPPDGLVSLPFYGAVRVGGKSTPQVEAILRGILLRELKQPRVSVSITKFRELTTGRVYLLGAVTSPGSIDIREGFRLTEVLAAAGGLGGRLDEKRATLSRTGQPPIRLDLARAISQPNSGANIRLRPNDTITIEAVAPGRVVISGDVAQPGGFELHRDPQLAARELPLSPRLSDLILAAGGLGRANVAVAATPSNIGGALGSRGALGSPGLPGSAGGAGATGATGATAGIPNAVGVSSAGGAGTGKFTGFLQRGGRRVELSVQEALRDVGGVYNIPLQAGDFVTIEAVAPPAPPALLKVYVSGFVGRPGSLSVEPGTRLLQVLAEAGGLTRTADTVAASVRRGRQGIAINLPAVVLNTESDANLELQAGDEVRIDEPSIIRVRVAGSVTSAGALRLAPNTTLLDALLQAGNLSIKPEDARISVLRREADGSQRIIEADAAPLLELRSVKDNIVLREGDLVNVSPVKMQTIFVLGQVRSQGAIEARSGEGLVELLTRAGGTTDDAALTRIAVERDGQTTIVDALDAIRLGRPLDFTLQAGDRVVVPENRNRVYVLEAVSKPGPIAIPERGTLTLAGALAQAGGPSQRTKEIVLVRTVNGTPQEFKFPISQVRSGAAGQQLLRAGDAIYVPATVARESVLNKVLPLLGIFRIF